MGAKFAVTCSCQLSIKRGFSEEDIIRDSLEAARLLDGPLSLRLDDGTLIIFNSDSKADLIMRDLWRVRNGYTSGVVGIHPDLTLSGEEYVLRRKRALEMDLPAFACYSDDSWPLSTTYSADADDEPGEDCDLEYAERLKHEKHFWLEEVLPVMELWARLMQIKLDNGLSLNGAWRPAYYEAGLDGADPSFMSDVTSAALIYWLHGRGLRGILRHAGLIC